MVPHDPEAFLAVASRFENIELVQAVVDDLLGRLGLEEEERHWFGLAVREAVANAIKHGNRSDPGKQVEGEGGRADGGGVGSVGGGGGGVGTRGGARPTEPGHG